MLLQLQANRIIENDITCFGCRIEDIDDQELLLDIKLPLVYKEFLTLCGMSSGHLFCGCKVELSEIDFINRGGRRNYEDALGYDCSENIFFIMEHHGYSYYYFDITEGDNPDIWILVNGEELTHEPIGKIADVLDDRINRLQKNNGL